MQLCRTTDPACGPRPCCVEGLLVCAEEVQTLHTKRGRCGYYPAESARFQRGETGLVHRLYALIRRDIRRVYDHL